MKKSLKQELEDREELLCEKIDTHEKLCYCCRSFIEHRIPEHKERHGDLTGCCIFPDPERSHADPSDLTYPLIVNAESTCENFEDVVSWIHSEEEERSRLRRRMSELLKKLLEDPLQIINRHYKKKKNTKSAALSRSCREEEF